MKDQQVSQTQHGRQLQFSVFFFFPNDPYVVYDSVAVRIQLRVDSHIALTQVLLLYFFKLFIYFLFFTGLSNIVLKSKLRSASYCNNSTILGYVNTCRAEQPVWIVVIRLV